MSGDGSEYVPGTDLGPGWWGPLVPSPHDYYALQNSPDGKEAGETEAAAFNTGASAAEKRRQEEKRESFKGLGERFSGVFTGSFGLHFF